ncbi:MAM and LDL-receptor class A domain-containing protein 1-like [Haliotis rubra]|uniref:MAM and LDL-receptor class A domain-containing protein 1-like n=1 Tax=Haliotis rubra TaxID=36100 RepID=UPI001EE5FAC2|nr:MAM and LDL-receptor class A domain-containing protein 1-like [Haliotis rubra]
MTAAVVTILWALAVGCSAVNTKLDCPFETNFCLWTKDQGTDKFDWNLIPWTAQAGTGPSGDHTTGKGHYIHVGSSLGTNGDNAQLISPTLTIASGQSKCLVFYYTMYGEHVNNLNVYGKTSTTRNRIWTRHGNQGTDWIEARIALPEASDFQVVIEAVRGDGEKGDIFIDDIKVIDGPCSLQASKLITCSFDNDMCGWTQMKNDDFDWTRHQGSTASSGTGPLLDHTTGKGYYLYTEVSGLTANKTARIQSNTIIPRLVTQCLSFWYHMHGDHIGTLNVYIKSTSMIGSPIWTKTGTQGLTWNQAAITVVEGHTPYSVVIEAVTADGYNGGIAVDDVLLADNACTVRPVVHTTVHPGQVVRKCDFEGISMCGYTQDTTDTFDWTLTSHATSTDGTGPSNDHTYGTSSGHYLYTEASSRIQGDTARILSPTYHDSQAMCVKFYYHMYGSSMGTLNVYVKVGNNRGRPLFVRSGNQGNYWSFGQATIPATSASGYQMVFEGISGSNYKSDIALDDVKFTVGVCSIPGDCTFESGLCTWSNTGMGDQFDWTLGSGLTSSSSTGPSSDHTLGIGQGRYLYIEPSVPRLAGDKAWLVSESFAPSHTSSCISFWYSMYGATVGSLNVYIRVPGRTDKMIWHQSGNRSNGWFLGEAPITERFSSYTIVFEGVRGISYTGDIAIDDITVMTSYCGIIPPNAAAVLQTTAQVTTQSVGKAALSCDFQNDFCGWVQISRTDLSDWNRRQGITSGRGPSTDHTFGNSNGYYIHSEPSSVSGKTRDKARLFSPLVQAGQSCITFWYNMYGSNVGALNVYVQTGIVIPSTPTWKRTGTQGTHWLMGQISVNVKIPFNVVIEGVSGGNQGVTAIDDVNIANGSCSAGATVGPSSKPAADKCNFEDTILCGFSQDVDHSDNFDWSRHEGATSSFGTGPSSDHTYGTRLGHYMYIETSAPRRPGDVARLNSFILTGPTSPPCLTFWYHMYGISIGTLNVYVMRNGARGSPLWHLSGNQGNSWKMAKVSLNTVASNTSYQIVFEGTVGAGYEGDIAIDDFSVTAGACSLGVIPNAARPTVTQKPTTKTAPQSTTGTKPTPKPTGDCTFESGLCTWSNTGGGDQFDWILGSGMTSSSYTGPSRDHTLGNAQGRYLFIETSAPRLAGDKAWLVSESFPPSNTSSCINFWYSMYGATVGSLNVYIRVPGRTDKMIWHQSGNRSNGWFLGEAPITERFSSYTIVFEGVRGISYTGDIAIDDITVMTGYCGMIPNAARPTVTQKPTTTAPQSTEGNKATPKTYGQSQDAAEIVCHSRVYPSSYTGTTLGPSSKPAADKCTFEDIIICGFSQDLSDDFDWSRHEGPTSSTGTGPASDHTYGTMLGHYMYIESSEPRRPNDVARLNSIILTGPISPTCLTFWYHMYGSSIGALNVYIMRNGAKGSLILHLSGNQGNSWKAAEVSLNTVSSNTIYQIVFEGTVGAGYSGDIAIDDISVTTGACSSDVTPNAARPTVTQKPTSTAPQSTTGTKATPKPTGTTVAPSSKPAADKCNFEDNIICGFSQDHSDDFDWTKHEGPTSSFGTGPSSDHTYGTRLGHYMYIESSAPRRPGDVARLNSFILTGPTSPSCLTFWYHMYGISIGSLNVYVMRNGARGSPLWHLSGNQGNSWKVAKVSLSTVSSNTSYQIVFEGTVGAGYSGDIAIDDFSVTTGACSSDVIPKAARPTVTQKPTTTAPQSTTGTKPTPKPTVIPKATRPTVTQRPTTTAPQSTTGTKPTPKPTDG